MKRGKWEHTCIIELGDKFEFCVVNEDGISCVHYGPVIAIDDSTKTFTFTNSKGQVFDLVDDRHIRGISRVENWDEV